MQVRSSFYFVLEEISFSDSTPSRIVTSAVDRLTKTTAQWDELHTRIRWRCTQWDARCMRPLLVVQMGLNAWATSNPRYRGIAARFPTFVLTRKNTSLTNLPECRGLVRLVISLLVRQATRVWLNSMVSLATAAEVSLKCQHQTAAHQARSRTSREMRYLGIISFCDTLFPGCFLRSIQPCSKSRLPSYI